MDTSTYRTNPSKFPSRYQNQQQQNPKKTENDLYKKL